MNTNFKIRDVFDCPDCQDHHILDEDLECNFCKGKYIWQKGSITLMKENKE